jgi:hypothetical protein
MNCLSHWSSQKHRSSIEQPACKLVRDSNCWWRKWIRCLYIEIRWCTNRRESNQLVEHRLFDWNFERCSRVLKRRTCSHYSTMHKPEPSSSKNISPIFDLFNKAICVHILIAFQLTFNPICTKADEDCHEKQLHVSSFRFYFLCKWFEWFTYAFLYYRRILFVDRRFLH